MTATTVCNKGIIAMSISNPLQKQITRQLSLKNQFLYINDNGYYLIAEAPFPISYLKYSEPEYFIHVNLE